MIYFNKNKIKIIMEQEENKFTKLDYINFLKENYKNMYRHRQFKEIEGVVIQELFDKQIKSKTKIIELIKNKIN